MKRIILILTISSFVCGGYQLQAMQKPTAFIITKSNNIGERRKAIENNTRTMSGSATDVRKGIEKDNRFKVPRIQETPEKIDIENDIYNDEILIQLASHSSQDNYNASYQIGALLNTSTQSSPSKPFKVNTAFLADFNIESDDNLLNENY